MRLGGKYMHSQWNPSRIYYLVIDHDILLQCSLIPRLSQATGGGGSVWNQYASITVLFLYREARFWPGDAMS